MLKRPAWPATPPIRRAVGSCTTPRSMARQGAVQGQASGAQGTVGAMRSASTAGGRNSCRPSRADRRRAPQECRQRLPRHDLDDVAKQEEADVRVDEALAGRGHRHLFTRQPDRLGSPAVKLHAEVEIRAQARDVRQQVTNRDPVLAVPFEARDVGADAIGQPDAAILDQRHHRRRRRHHLGERGDVENRVERHRLRRGLHRAVAEGATIEHLVSAAGDDDGAGNLSGGDRLLDQRLDQREPRRVERGPMPARTRRQASTGGQHEWRGRVA